MTGFEAATGQLEVTEPTLGEQTLAYEEIAAQATGRTIRVGEELELFKDARSSRHSFLDQVAIDIAKWGPVLEASRLIGLDKAISPAILTFQRDALAMISTIREAMLNQARTTPTPEEERALAARFFYWRAARFEWVDFKESR